MNETNEKKKTLFATLLIVLVISTLLFGLIKIIPKKELISTKTYDIYELTLDENYIYFSFIDENSRINKDYYTCNAIFDLMYLDTSDKVTIENYGYNGKIKKVVLKKFHITKETYEMLKKEYNWEKGYNMDNLP